jgi:predicted nucleic-acid-binding Zn-ribbon protein
MAVSAEEFQAFFKEMKNGTYKCPFCSKEVFLVNGLQAPDVNTPAHLQIQAWSDEGKLLGGHNFYSISCANCGHSDFFHIHQINAFLESRKKKGSV